MNSFFNLLANANEMFYLIRNNEEIQSFNCKHENNTLTLVNCDFNFYYSDKIKYNNNIYSIVNIDSKEKPFAFGKDIVLTIKPFIEEKATFINNITVNGSNNTINSNNISFYSDEILKLPEDVQSLAYELLTILIDCVNKQIKPPKNFKNKFGSFIEKYGDKIISFGNLALNTLLLFF